MRSDTRDAETMASGRHRLKMIEHSGKLIVFCPADLSLAIVPLGGGLPITPPALTAAANARPHERNGPRARTEDDGHSGLDRLTLVVANTCNLSCSYCYALGGTYYSQRRLCMRPETALQSLNWAAREFPLIRHLSFFGGEPTMNTEVVQLACEYSRFLVGKGLLAAQPTLGLTTNGYILDEPFLRFLTSNDFSVTLSLDGPRHIHDRLRPTKTGSGSYDSVAHNAHRLLEAGIDVEFECTYTAHHLRAGIDICSLMDFFHSEFGTRTLHCPVVAANPDEDHFLDLPTCLRLQGEAIEYSVANLSRGVGNAISTAVRLIGALARRVPIRDYCPAGRSQITINVDGSVYACFMLMGEPARKHVPSRGRPAMTPRVRRGAAASQRLGHISEAGRGVPPPDKFEEAACLRCWAQPLCHGCIGEDARRFGRHIPPSEKTGTSQLCDYRRGLIETLLRALAEHYS